MKTNFTIQDEPNRYDLLSEKDIEKIVKAIQDDTDRDILDRYAWDWEFRQAVDKMVGCEGIEPDHCPGQSGE